MKKTLLSLTAAMLLVAPVAFAQVPPGPQVQTQWTTLSGILAIFNRIVNWVFSFLLVLAVIFILYAAFMYLTAAGDPAKVKKASHTLIYAAVAIGVALLSMAIPALISSFISQGGQV